MPAVAPPDLNTDVCVVGGSIAGLMIALRLARQGLDVLLLERGLITPIRRPAVLAAGTTLWLGATAGRFSKERARATFDLSLEAMAKALALFDELGVERQGRGLLRVAAAHESAALDAEEAARDLLGLAELRRWSRDEIEAVTASQRYVGAFYEPHGVLFDTEALSSALTAAALAAGVRILELTPAVAADLAGVRKYVHTSEGRVRADHVVLCAGRGIGRVTPWLAAALGREHWVRGGFAVRTARPDFSGLVAEPGWLGARFVPSDGELMFEAPTATAVHGEVPAAVTLRRRARAVYPELRLRLAEHAGGFSQSRAPCGLPLIGEHRPGVWHAAGLGANGLANAALAADAICAGIVERGRQIDELAAPAPRYAFGAAGRVAATAGFWALRLRDGLAHGLAVRAARRAEARAEAAAASTIPSVRPHERRQMAAHATVPHASLPPAATHAGVARGDGAGEGHPPVTDAPRDMPAAAGATLP